MAMGAAPVYTGQAENSAAVLTFDHYGDQYFLTQVMPGFEGVGIELNTSAEEHRTAKEQTANKLEKVTVLAMR